MKYRWIPASGAALAMAVLILDPRTALQGTSEGIALCLQTVIPSLFPFLLLSYILTASLSATAPKFLKPLGKWLGISTEAVPIYLIGLVGGYPAGAQAVSVQYSSGALSAAEARRMVVFCNNAGPAFFFGIGAVVFGQASLALLLWVIQILSSLCCARCLGRQTDREQTDFAPIAITRPEFMKKTVENMAMICAWVVIFRILLAFLQHWFLWMLPIGVQVGLCGVLEMTNGCCQLTDLPLLGQRLLFFSAFSAFGGFCILLQTFCITANSHIPIKMYLPGKLLQLSFSILMATAAQLFLVPSQRAFPSAIILGLCFLYCLTFLLIRRKKDVAIPRKLMYNEEKYRMRGNHYAVSQKN